MLKRFVLPAVAALVALLPLASCGDSGRSNLPIACPQRGILGEASDLTMYRPGAANDLSNMILDARVTGIDLTCRRGRGDQPALAITVVATIAVERGPASTQRDVTLPWFIGVSDTKQDRILSRQAYLQNVTFPANSTRAIAGTQEIELTLPVTEARRPADYKIWVGFMLTDEQLALNRQRGLR